MKKYLLIIMLLGSAALALGNSQALLQKRNAKCIYVAPAESGDGSGVSPKNAAQYTNQKIWQQVNELLKNDELTVCFVDGHYSTKKLALTGIGNDKHKLTIKGSSRTGVVLDAPVGTMMSIDGCKNLVLENLNFTGPTKGYCLRITKDKKGNPSRNIEINKCSWYDLTDLYYGCVGVHSGSNHVTLNNCTFKRAGMDSHCHMIYNAYKADYVNVFNCHFEDCSGAYVRYRDKSDYGVISGNTFVSTGTYKNYNPQYEVFIGIPNFNDVDPGDEQFGTHYMITKNTFKFTPKPDAFRTGIRFHHSGFNYPGYKYLMNAEQGKILESDDSLAKMKLLQDNCGLNFDYILIKDNVWQSENWKMQFTSKAMFGAESKGWNDSVDISGIIKYSGAKLINKTSFAPAKYTHK